MGLFVTLTPNECEEEAGRSTPGCDPPEAPASLIQRKFLRWDQLKRELHVSLPGVDLERDQEITAARKSGSGNQNTTGSSDSSSSNMPMAASTSSGETSSIPAKDIANLSPESRSYVENLLRYQAPPLPDFGLVKQAAVLVALFEKPGDDQLSVLLTTRAKTLRRHPSQTALPGGKVDPEDHSAVHTAYREASEEVGLPLPPHSSIHHLTVLDPVMTILPLNAHLRNHIVVVPVVCFISDPSLVATLKPAPEEVDMIFSHPLKGCHTGVLRGRDVVGLAERGDWWPHEEEFHSAEDRMGVTGGYRMHRFRTTHTPIKGLTSDVLIDTATIAFASPPKITRYAPHQPDFATAIANVVLELPGVVDSVEISSGEKRVLEWGGPEPGMRIKSRETWHDPA